MVVKFNEMNENQKVGLKVLKVIQSKCSARFNAFIDTRLELAYQCSQINPVYTDIATKVKHLMYMMDLNSAMKKFIELKGEVDISDKPVQQELIKKEEAPKTVSPKVESPMPDMGYMGLLEKALAEVVVRNQGETIKNEIIGNFEEIAKKFMLDNYGIVQKKIEVEVKDKKVKFQEVLHEKFDTVLKFVHMDEPVFLTGRAGTGKNVLCKQVAKALGLDFYFTNAVTQEYKLTGFTDASGVYHQTQFYEAFTKGGLFMLDEMDASIPEVLVILNCAIANRYFDFPSGKDKDGNEVGGFTKAHPNFRVISAGNTFGLGADYEYVGRNQLDMASLNRFAVVEIDYDKQIENNVAQGDTELVDFCESIRKSALDSGTRMVVSYRDISRITKMKNLLSLKETLQTCLVKNLRSDDLSSLISGMKLSSENIYFKTLKEILG